MKKLLLLSIFLTAFAAYAPEAHAATPAWKAFLTDYSGYPSPTTCTEYSAGTDKMGICHWWPKTGVISLTNPTTGDGIYATNIAYCNAYGAYQAPNGNLDYYCSGRANTPYSYYVYSTASGDPIQLDWSCVPNQYVSFWLANAGAWTSFNHVFGSPTITASQGSVPTNGALIGQTTVYPAGSAWSEVTYTMRCGSYDTGTMVARIASPTVSLVAAPDTVVAGGQTTLSWQAQYLGAGGACSVRGAGNELIGSGVQGSAQVTVPSDNYTYTLACTNSSGAYQDTAVVRYAPPQCDAVLAQPIQTLNGASWASVGSLPGNLGYSSFATIGDYIYLFGGWTGTDDSRAIYRAPVSDPTAWVNTGALLPHKLESSSLAIIGDYVYLFGGYSTQLNALTNNIYRAPLSNPLSWVDTGSNIPVAMRWSSLAMIGDYVYLFGGYNNSVNLNGIYRAPISNPLSWSTTGATLPSGVSGSSIAVVDGYVYLFDGSNGTGVNVIYRAPTSNPLSWTNTGAGMPANIAAASLITTNDSLYLLGGHNGTSVNTIYKAPLTNPLSWSTENSILPGNLKFSKGAVINGKAYLFGGQSTEPNAVNTVFRATLGQSYSSDPSHCALGASPSSVLRTGTSTITWSCPVGDTSSSGTYFSTAGALFGTTTVSLVNTTDYKLSCSPSGIGGEKTVSVSQPSLTLTATPSAINSGQSSTLTWSTQNVSGSPACTLTSPGGGLLATGNNNSTGVSSGALSQSSQFTLNCSLPTGSTSTAAQVQVVDVPTIAMTLSAAQQRVRAGRTTQLNWSVGGLTSGTSCSIAPALEGGVQSWNGSGTTWVGSAQTQAINQRSTFVLSCTAGQTQESRTVIVDLIPQYTEI